ncbi:hypothetical protein [Mariniblastus fucicola]|uniref:Uncharacterized protein n=1 Tax=Mariniblastus fucicola TaxID=980251 RepID=A0A5B9PDG3_9BACT|nr:hypothetical protein [Mariniblastus fucicola]QEG22942.1 hypothetical protein MFFC18_28300 [Mariniblastus fucicola]
MRSVLSLAIAVCILSASSVSFAQLSKKNGFGQSKMPPTVKKDPAEKKEKPPGEDSADEDTDAAANNNAGPAKNNAAKKPDVPAEKKLTPAERKEKLRLEVKKQYEDLFSSTEKYEVRLSNKALALKRGRLMATTKKNGFVVFESSRMIVAVPTKSLHKKLAAEVKDRLDKAKEIYAKTRIACEDVLEIPETGEEKLVGLAGRQKFKMFIHRKPKPDPKKKSSNADENAAAKTDSDSKEKEADEPSADEKDADKLQAN